MSTNEKIGAAESALQSGESVYSSCSQRLQDVQQKKQEIEQQNRELQESYIQTQQEEEQARQQVASCEQRIASLESRLSSLQSQSSSEDEDDSSRQSEIAEIQSELWEVEQEKRENEAIIDQCRQRYNEIRSALLQNKNALAQCEAEITRIHSECQSSISSMGHARQPLLQLIPALGAAAVATQKISSLRFGGTVAAQKNAWSQGEKQRSESVSNSLSSCIAKTEQLLGMTSPNPSAVAADQTGSGGSASSGGFGGFSHGASGSSAHNGNANNSSGGQSQYGSQNGSASDNSAASRAVANWQIEKAMMDEGLVRYANMGGLDPKTSMEIYNTVSETKQLFPELDMGFVGSTQARNKSIEKVLENSLLEKYRQEYPLCSDEDFMPLVRLEIDNTMAGLKPKKSTIAQSLSCPPSASLADCVVSRYNGISINEAFGADYDNFKKEKIKDVQAKWKPVGCDTPKATADHELGHQIDKLVDASNDPVINQLYIDFLKEPLDNRGNVLSGYAGSTDEYGRPLIGEFIAEGWSEYRNNPNCRSTAASIANRIFELYKEKYPKLVKVRRR
ncbi:MAG: hypothetical protein IKK75_13195 [Clostridia bacterium]|nr:hypothetical protein [Clostridia bacterium]